MTVRSSVPWTQGKLSLTTLTLAPLLYENERKAFTFRGLPGPHYRAHSAPLASLESAHYLVKLIVILTVLQGLVKFYSQM